jgi:hypothetical protein
MKANLFVPLLVLALSGCSTTVPVVAKFPEVPSQLTVACAKLKEADSKPELSELTKTILHNYAEYHICAIRLDAWNEWYIEQKKLFEALK